MADVLTTLTQRLGVRLRHADAEAKAQAAQSALTGALRALAAELAPDVRLNVINPGPANTPMLGGFGFDADVAIATGELSQLLPDLIDVLGDADHVHATVRAYVDRVSALPGVADWIQGALAEQDFLDFEEPYRLKR